MAIIELAHVVKSFGTFKAVEDFSLKTEDGELVVMVGPSGCGKTTSMRMIAGLETPTSGTIEIDGEDVTEFSPTERDVAMVFQNYALYPHLTVYENIAFCLRVRHYTKSHMDQAIDRVARSLGIADLLQRKPSELSGGQRQRVALGRAIVRQPRVFLMDEPLSNLDAKLRIEMRAEIVKLCRHLNVTTFYVTHDQLEAMTMGHRIVVMQKGQIQQIDTPQGIFDAPVNRFVAGFIGSPPMNFLQGTTTSGGAVLEGPGFRLQAGGRLAKGLKVIAHAEVGIRPEHLRPVTKAADSGWIEGRIEVIEPLGSQVMVQLAVGSTNVVAQFRRCPALRIGDALRLEQEEPDVLHAFDVKTGRSALAA